jgi:hypothetical protein
MDFGLVVLTGFVLLALVLLAIGKWYPGTGAEVLDWQPTRSVEDEVKLELEDVDQMLEAQNERRRRSGRPEITEDEVRAEVEADQRDRQALAQRYRRGAPETESD